ncbi:MAG: hypothetical protein LBF72_02025 [Holosporales bacterium]|nr:hypothetical protein [Holosporales bacterium]
MLDALLKPSNVGGPAKTRTLLGSRLDELANFLWLSINCLNNYQFYAS